MGPDVDKMCFGDFNARTWQDLDFLDSEDNRDIPVPLDRLYVSPPVTKTSMANIYYLYASLYLSVSVTGEN